jgi:hypothetical protein
MSLADIKAGVRLWIAARQAVEEKHYAALMATECEVAVRFVVPSASPRRKATAYAVLDTPVGTVRADFVEVIDETTKRPRLHIRFHAEGDTPEYVVMAVKEMVAPSASEYPTVD